MDKLRIVYLDGHCVNPGDLSWDELTALGQFTAYERTAPDEVLERAADADVLITNKVRLGREHFACLPQLRLVCVSATGYDVVDTQAARSAGIGVCNCPDYSTASVAQMALALLLEATNQVGFYAQANRQGYWTSSADFCKWEESSFELAGKRAAVVGFGHIGRALTELLRPLGMKLTAVTSKLQSALPTDVAKCSLEEAMAQSDVVSLHCPLTPSNARFVDAALLSACKPGQILINTARGGLVDEQAVADALGSGRLRAYCADVLSQEPPSTQCPLLAAPRAYITPHVAWATREARSRIISIVAANIDSFRQGGAANIVN